MNQNTYRAAFVCLLLFLAGCASQKPGTSTTNNTSSQYSEDLSGLRPKVEEPKTETGTVQTTNDKKQSQYVEPKLAVNKQLDTVLDSIDRINLERKVVDGFSIQVYSGRREEALNVKKQLSSMLPNLQSEVQFTEPIFRVKAGKYYNRMDAQKDYSDIKRYFPAAIIIPERIEIN